jgi:hypothetical protein
LGLAGLCDEVMVMVGKQPVLDAVTRAATRLLVKAGYGLAKAVV